MKLAFVLALLLSTHVDAQIGSFDFYGDKFELPVLSTGEKDSLLEFKGVPARIKTYITESRAIAELDDWGLVYFIDAFVDAQFINAKDSDKVKIVNMLLTELSINNAIGKISKGLLLSLVSIDNKSRPINDARYFEKDGYKYMPVKRQSKVTKLRDIEMYCRAEYKDIQLDYVKTPNIRNVNASRKELSFFNYCSGKKDSVEFDFSKSYNRYYNDLPRIIPDHHYYMAPVSPIFQNSFFSMLDGKLGQCRYRLDSINFLIKFVQSGIQFEEDKVVYGKEDWCSFPENTFALGKGDCEDKCEAFAFLVNHYFKNTGIVFLFYTNHVRIGLRDPNLSLTGKPYQKLEGQTYFEVELQGNDTVLADDSFALFPSTPLFITN
ncbi:hypothetical protein [Puia dinghuensis]|uniref:Transglutaminase domain-containing protein n=1 Tax=Puia dinghuensis TaxID=1792502 RepID=A0A8J2U735_9BACT|nr:hypothetical protein [Puia dinghuensis]GGA83104.1 hypothetical protein GCM10011511_02660 [Puia dinghuensis]